LKVLARSFTSGFVMFQFTREIWKTFAENAYERAKYLHGLYSKESSNFKPKSYLDIGAGLGYNALIFGKDLSEVVAIDLQFPKKCILKDSNKASLIVADAQFLPFKDELFDMISLFPVIEHITNQELALKEAWRVLKSRGKLIIQIPNKFFPLELHSGLPFIFLFPSRIRGFILKKMGYRWLTEISIPSKKRLKEIIYKINSSAKIHSEKIIYPPSLVPLKLRRLYILFGKVLILNLIPLGFLFIVEKLNTC